MVGDVQKQSGQIWILSVIVVGLVLANTLVVIGGSQTFFQNTSYIAAVDQAVNLAEAGADKALNSLNKSGGSYTGESETPLGAGSFEVTIASPNPNTKVIESTGYIPSKTSPKAKRTIKVTASKGVGAAFNYGIQVGDGGLRLEENSVINGSVYSNGNIEMANNARITGDAYVAGGVAGTADQQYQCDSCSDFVFGTNVSGSNRLDVAQSFRPALGGVISKVSLKLKKTGNPPDMTVRLLADQNGQPDKNTVLASGTLAASLVTGTASFVDAAFSSSPMLTAEASYWIVLDASFNASNYWSWSVDSSQGYTRGAAKWSSDWQAGNPSWNLVSADLSFKTFMGGVATSIAGANGARVGGNAYANTLRNLIVGAGAYYQVAENVTAQTLYPNSTGPAPKAMPVSAANIASWKSEAADPAQGGGVYGGDITSCQAGLAKGKYLGNVSFSNNCTVMVEGTVWITGNLNLNNGVTLQLHPSYGAFSGVIIVDGTVNLSNNNKLKGSGTAGSYLILLSTYDSTLSGVEAIDVTNNGNQGALYAGDGIIRIANGNSLIEVTAWQIHLKNGVEVNYDSGLAGAFFSSGPSGSFSLVKGTYQLK